MLGPCESQDIVIIASSLPSGHEGHGSGVAKGDYGSRRCLMGALMITYTEELLRRRLRSRLAQHCQKSIAAVKKHSSSIDWDTSMRGDKLAKKSEEDSLPSYAYDGKLFFTSTRQLKVNV